MKKYKVFWKESKYVIVKAKDAEEAVNKVWVNENNIKKFESERTSDIDAVEIK